MAGRAGGTQTRKPLPGSRGSSLASASAGFVDGIVLHQLLQRHHLLTGRGYERADTVAGLELNTLADGLFHVATWVLVLVGVLLTVREWRAGRLAPSWRAYSGALLVGWGLFNLVEGVVDHLVLGIHHVRDDLGGPLAWDLGFLVFGAVLLLAGAALARAGRTGSA